MIEYVSMKCQSPKKDSEQQKQETIIINEDISVLYSSDEAITLKECTEANQIESDKQNVPLEEVVKVNDSITTTIVTFLQKQRLISKTTFKLLT